MRRVGITCVPLRALDVALGVRAGVALTTERVAARPVGARRAAVGDAGSAAQADFAVTLEARRVAARRRVARRRVARRSIALAAGAGRREATVALLHARSAVGATRLTATAADGSHVLAVAADGHAALATRRACLAGVEFVRRALLVRRAASL